MRVRVEPSEVEFEVEPGSSVMGAAETAGYYWPTICGGRAECAACYMTVLEGGSDLDPIGNLERAGITLLPERVQTDPATRLACQAKGAAGLLVVRKRGVRPTDRVADGR